MPRGCNSIAALGQSQILSNPLKSGFRVMTTCKWKISHHNRLVPVLSGLVKAGIFSTDRLLAIHNRLVPILSGLVKAGIFSTDRLLAIPIPIGKWVIRGRLVSWKNNDKTFSGEHDVELGEKISP